MFGRLSNIFTTNEDHFTRTQSQFIEHWRCVTDSLGSQSEVSGSTASDVYNTKASVHIADMIYMIERDHIPEDSDYGACVEFILHHDVLATLQTYAQADRPPGMRKLVLTFFSQLVQKLQRSAIPHLNVHKPLQDMICICGGGKYPIDEINFITSVLGKFHEDPSLVNLFMNETKGKNGIVNYELRLVDALISLSHNTDDRVVKKSCESLLLCVSADSEYVIENILSYTILVQDLVSRLCQRYNTFQSDPSVLLETHITWNNQLELNLVESADRTTANLLIWVDYLNTLAASSHPNFTNKLLRHFSKVFLSTHLLNDFNSREPMFAIKALNTAQKMLSVATSELLLVEVLKFLTEDSIMACLCGLLNNPSSRVVETVLFLFNELIETHHSLVIETLILRHTKRNINVRSRLLLGKEDRPSLKRTLSGDSGVEEMLSDEETSFIHMNTALLSHFEPDQHSPSLPRKLADITSDNITSSADNITSSADLLQTCEISSISSSKTDTGISSDLSSLALDEATSSSSLDTYQSSCLGISSSDLVKSSEPVVSSHEPVVSSTPVVPSETDSPSETAIEASDEPGKTDSTVSSVECTTDDTRVLSPVPQSITLEHNRVGSPNHFKTVIVSHDHVEDVRRSSKEDDARTIKLDSSVARLLHVMPSELNHLSRMSGFPEYLHDAHIKDRECSLQYAWITNHAISSCDDQELTASVGTFLDKIISLIPNIPYQSYEINMLLMSLISEICYIPHQTATLYLLDTDLPSAPLYTNLKETAQQFKDIFEASCTLKEQLSVPESEMPDVCRAAIITEEFCKELAAIALVKSTN